MGHEGNFLVDFSPQNPELHEQTVGYYGWYSNRARGFRKAHGLLPPATPAQPAPEADGAPLAIQRPWARLIRQVYEADS